MSWEYNKSINWVRTKIDKARTAIVQVKPNGYVVIADATFFGMFNGFIVFRIPELKRNVYFSPITYESIFEYYKGRMTLEKQGIIIKAIVLDGRPGVRKVFADVPTQMCHFHQKQIIRRYLTNNPKL